MIRLGLHSSRAAQQSPALHGPDFCTKSERREVLGTPVKGGGSWGASVQLLWGSFPGKVSALGGFPQVAAARMAHFPNPKGKKLSVSSHEKNKNRQ